MRGSHSLLAFRNCEREAKPEREATQGDAGAELACFGGFAASQ